MNRLKKAKNKKIAGVCQGIANWLNIDVMYVRAAWIFLGLVPFVGHLSVVGAYALLAYLLPEDNDYIDI